MKIIILNDNFFKSEDLDKFGIDFFNKNNVIVENWTLVYVISKLYKKKYIKDSYNGEIKKNFKNLLIKTQEDAINKIKDINTNKTYFISITNINSDKYRIISVLLKEINLLNLPIIGYDPSLVPSRVIKTNYFKLIFIKRKVILQKIYSKLINFNYRKNSIFFKKKINYYDLYFICGLKSLDRINKFLKNGNKKTKIVKSCSYDYSRYLKFNSKSSKNRFKKYCIFIDEFNLHHPDADFGHKMIVNKNYYKEINIFFEQYEKFTGNEIIIAKHPKNNLINIYNRFEFPYIFDYIENAENILVHSSTATNIAVLFKKPILFLNSKSYSYAYQRSINIFAETLKQKLVFIDKPNNFFFNNINLKINENLYNNYIKDFINCGNLNYSHLENFYNEFDKQY